MVDFLGFWGFLELLSIPLSLNQERLITVLIFSEFLLFLLNHNIQNDTLDLITGSFHNVLSVG